MLPCASESGEVTAPMQAACHSACSSGRVGSGSGSAEGKRQECRPGSLHHGATFLRCITSHHGNSMSNLDQFGEFRLI